VPKSYYLTSFKRVGWWLGKVRVRLNNGTGAELGNNMCTCYDDMNQQVRGTTRCTIISMEFVWIVGHMFDKFGQVWVGLIG
jgi:hypothetical protein